jgi:hypothetical protein
MKTVNVETTDLTSNALDWAIATQKGLPIIFDPMGFKVGSEAGFWIWGDKSEMLLIGRDYSPTHHWEKGGEIIEQEGISLLKDGNWVAKTQEGAVVTGETVLLTAMKAYVTQCFGKRIDIPEYFL